MLITKKFQCATELTRFQLTDDTCIMDDEHFFVRGCIEIPVIDSPEPFMGTSGYH